MILTVVAWACSEARHSRVASFSMLIFYLGMRHMQGACENSVFFEIKADAPGAGRAFAVKAQAGAFQAAQGKRDQLDQGRYGQYVLRAAAGVQLEFEHGKAAFCLPA